jgi:hypothetical protein
MKKTKKIKQEEAHNNIKTSGKSKEKQTFAIKTTFKQSDKKINATTKKHKEMFRKRKQ